MNDRIRELHVSVVVLALGVVVLTLMAFRFDYRNRIEPCPEDAVLIGVGEFDGERWDDYECGPARDSYMTERDIARYICENPNRWYVEPTACRKGGK